MPGNFKDSVTISKSPFKGEYVYNTNSQAGLLTYYKKSGGETDIHFSVVDTNAGKSPLKKFHISKAFEGKNFHIRFSLWNGVVRYINNNADELPSREKRSALEFFDTNKSKLFQAAEEFASGLPKGAIAFAASAEEPATHSGATPVFSQVKLTATPILSQANAVGQGFNIFGTFDVESLMRPLVDLSRAPTQVFTFLGKEYLIPAYVTAIESTSSYSNVAAGENRDGFQNTIATHAGVEGSYGAFSGEMKADFAGEYKENAAFTYGFLDFYTSLATLQLNTTEYLTADFLRTVAELPDVATEDTLPPFIDFFTRYGIYYTQRVTLGGSLGFYTALSKRDLLRKAEFEVLLKAQYKALFSSGQLDAKVKASAEWQQYSEASVTNVRVLGGSPTAAAALASVDPLGFSEATVAAFKGWTESVSSDPAIVDFALDGIWNVAGNKSGVIQAAWELFGQTMRPRLTVETATRNTPLPLPPAEPPVITIGRLIRPAEQPATPAGFQVVVLDGTNVSSAGVLLNRYFCVPPQPGWYNKYELMYEEMLAALQAPGLAQPGNVLVLASFGLDKGMPPTNEVYALLLSAGGGSLLRQWVATADPGSQIGNPSIWIGSPVNYCLVGLFGSGPDAGVEAYNSAQWMVPATLRTEVLFYRTSVTGQYTLGAGV